MKSLHPSEVSAEGQKDSKQNFWSVFTAGTVQGWQWDLLPNAQKSTFLSHTCSEFLWSPHAPCPSNVLISSRQLATTLVLYSLCPPCPWFLYQASCTACALTMDTWQVSRGYPAAICIPFTGPVLPFHRSCASLSQVLCIFSRKVHFFKKINTWQTQGCFIFKLLWNAAQMIW